MIKKLVLWALAIFGAIMLPLVLLSAFHEPTYKLIYVDRPVPEVHYVNMNIVIHGISINSVVEYLRDHSPQDYAKVLWFYNQRVHNLNITQIIVESAIIHGVPIDMAFGMARQESNFDPKCPSYNKKSNTWDLGLFQLNTGSHKDWRLKDFYNVQKNTDNAMQTISDLVKERKYLALDLSLAGYNAGDQAVINERLPWTTSLHVFIVRQFERQYDLEFCRYLIPMVNVAGIDFSKLD